MKNLTIRVDEDLVDWVRVEAAKEGTSMSQYIAALLEETRRREEAYEEARRRFVSREPKSISDNTDHYPSRAQIHER